MVYVLSKLFSGCWAHSAAHGNGRKGLYPNWCKVCLWWAGEVRIEFMSFCSAKQIMNLLFCRTSLGSCCIIGGLKNTTAPAPFTPAGQAAWWEKARAIIYSVHFYCAFYLPKWHQCPKQPGNCMAWFERSCIQTSFRKKTTAFIEKDQKL